ncbi:MAG TPA: hypothetical protein VK196_18630 [Magnetospirillum sp.]|nr:hypothetical protein [Magnetospirillum sp.]
MTSVRATIASIDPADAAAVLQITYALVADKLRRGETIKTVDGCTGPEFRRRVSTLLMQARCGLPLSRRAARADR